MVNVKHKYPSGFRCFYLSAPNLTSTSDITLAGMKFVANRTDYVGMFSTTDYFPGPSGAYSININYSQAVLCEQIPDPSYNKIPRGRSTQLAEQFLPFHAFLLVLLLLALQ